MGKPARWSEEADDVIKGDITAAAAYLTPAGSAVVTAVAPCGCGQRDQGLISHNHLAGLRQEA